MRARGSGKGGADPVFGRRLLQGRGRAAALMDKVAGNLSDKTGGKVEIRLAVFHPLHGARQCKVFHSPGDTHIAEPTFLLDLLI